jgi:hypothetical protein
MFYHYASSTLQRHILCGSPIVVDERAAFMVRILEVPGLDLDPKTENRRVSRFSCSPTQIPGIVL